MNTQKETENMLLMEQYQKNMNHLLQMYSSASTMDEQEQYMVSINMNKKKLVDLKHTHEIWTGKDGKIRTYIYDHENVRKQKKLKDYDTMIEFLFKYYYDSEKKLTLFSAYDDWREYRLKTAGKTETVYRNDMDWKKYYLNDPVSNTFINTELHLMTKIKIQEWQVHLCKTYGLNSKKYYNITTIAKKIFEYLVDDGKLDENIYTKVKAPKNHFIHKARPKSNTEVFTDVEVKLFLDEAEALYKRNNNVFAYLACFLFYTGLRIGEASAIEWKDINDDYIYVHQTYARSKILEDGKWVNIGYTITPMLKKNAEPRQVPLIRPLRELLDKLKQHYEQTGETPTYVFEKNGKLAHPNSIGKMYSRLCRKCNIPERSPHKSRKTYVSTLIDHGISTNAIGEIVGHKDERTTLENYHFTRQSETDLINSIDNAFQSI